MKFQMCWLLDMGKVTENKQRITLMTSNKANNQFEIEHN